MRTLDELINRDDSAISLVREWVLESEGRAEILPPSAHSGEALYQTQVTTRSPMGAIVYESGGILVDNGWLRILGSGHERLPRSLPEWNLGRSQGFWLIADDAVGGFFALNGGAFGADFSAVYYWAPDHLDWEPLELGYTDFFRWCMTPRVAEFYNDLRWPSWREDSQVLSPDQCFVFFPFLWTEEGSVETSHRGKAPVEEVFASKMDLTRQFQQPTAN